MVAKTRFFDVPVNQPIKINSEIREGNFMIMSVCLVTINNNESFYKFHCYVLLVILAFSENSVLIEEVQVSDTFHSLSLVCSVKF